MSIWKKKVANGCQISKFDKCMWFYIIKIQDFEYKLYIACKGSHGSSMTVEVIGTNFRLLLIFLPENFTSIKSIKSWKKHKKHIQVNKWLSRGQNVKSATFA